MNSEIQEIARLERTNQALRDICRLHVRRIEELEAENSSLLRELKSMPKKGVEETPEQMHARIVTETADAIARQRGLTADDNASDVSVPPKRSRRC